MVCEHIQFIPVELMDCFKFGYTPVKSQPMGFWGMGSEALDKTPFTDAKGADGNNAV